MFTPKLLKNDISFLTQTRPVPVHTSPQAGTLIFQNPVGVNIISGYLKPVLLRPYHKEHYSYVSNIDIIIITVCGSSALPADSSIACHNINVQER